MEMKNLIREDKVPARQAIANVEDDKVRNCITKSEFEEHDDITDRAQIEVNTTAIVEPPARIYIEPPSNTSNSDDKESEVVSKSYVEFRAGELNYPRSDSDSQSSGSSHNVLPPKNPLLSRSNHIKNSDISLEVELKNELDLIPSAPPSLGMSLTQKYFLRNIEGVLSIFSPLHVNTLVAKQVKAINTVIYV